MSSGDVRGNGDFDFKSFFLDIPPVTRTLFLTTFVSTVITGIGFLPYPLFMLHWAPIVQNFQIWRILLTFFHMGGLGLGFLIRMYFLFVYSKQLEIGTFFGRPANYSWFLFLVAVFVLLASTVFPTGFNAGAFLLAIIHLWGHHADNVTVTMYGFIQIPAKYLSLVMLMLDIVIKGGFSTADALGLLAGHLYYFVDTVYPTMPQGKQMIFVPIWFERLIGQLQDVLGRATGLYRGPSIPPQASRDGFGRPSNTSGASGPYRGGARTSGAQAGYTVPSFRSGYNWGRGHTLGSS